MKGNLFLATMAFLFISYASLSAQEVWDLQKCVDFAFENSINLKQADLNIENAELVKKGNQYSRLPNLNGFTSFGFNFGRSIDPTTNSFETQNIRSNNLSLSANVPIFNGGQIVNSVKQSDFDLQAAKADKDATMNTLALDVASAYLSVLFNQDQVNIAGNRLKQTKDQLDRTNKLIKAGSLPDANRVDLEATQASDEQGVIAAENGLAIAYLNLKQLINLDPDKEIEIERPSVLTPEVDIVKSYTLEMLYNQALGTQPQIFANELRERSAQKGVDLSKSALFPSLALSGGLNTNYSSLGKDFMNPILTNIRVDEVNTDVLINSNPSTITFFEENADISFPDQLYFNQLDQNLSQNVGVSLSVPIFNRFSNRINIQRSKLNVINAKYTTEQSKIQLRADIQRALTDALAANKQLEFSSKTLTARELAFSNAEKRFELGSINSFEYNQAKDNLDVARSNESFSTYDYVFKLKVLDFYLGKTITLE